MDFTPGCIDIIHQREGALAQHRGQAAVFKRQAGSVTLHQGQAGISLAGAAEHAGGAVETHSPKPVVTPQVFNRGPHSAADVSHSCAGRQAAIGQGPLREVQAARPKGRPPDRLQGG